MVEVINRELTNEMTIFRKRKKQVAKLKRFFGKETPLDISVAEIQKYGLAALLQSNVPLCYFLFSMMENYCSENLFFYFEVEDFEAHHFKDKESQRRTAVNIYKFFIKENSDFEVNLDYKVIKPIKKAIENNDKYCFTEAKLAIYHIMEPSYIEFTLSPIWKQMVAEIGSNNTIYDRKARDFAINMLIKHFDKSLLSEEKGIKSSDAAVAAERARARLIRNLVHSFCRTRLKCDFYDKDTLENLPDIKRGLLAPPKKLF